MTDLSPKAYKSALKPIWCAGCGHFAVLNAVAKAFAALQLAKHNTVVVSGIGCSSRLPAYIDSYGFHGVHGRALPIATGIKVARPELEVIAVGGDGDGLSIGGNHFIHACRRNVNMVYIMMDNEVYGMTKGQASPTSPADWEHSKLTPHGSELEPMNPCSLALASGAGFIARGYSGDPNGLSALIVEAIRFPGFAFIQALSQCITFHPEQKDWKHSVTESTERTADNPLAAFTRLQHDGGMEKGIIYRQARPVWPPVSHIPVQEQPVHAGFVL